MKIAALGDIHGNHLALEVVLKAARRLGVERLLVTGDLVGYYFWPLDVLEQLQSWDAVFVRGNHEDMLAEARRDPDSLASIDMRYGTGLRVALETLSETQLDWLQNLPHPADLEIDGRRILLGHGTPWNVDEYLYPDAPEEMLARCAEGKHDFVVLGHTHYDMLRQSGTTLIVNPGSVGQPRNRQPGAHWALLDTQTGKVEPRCEAYDISWVVEQAKQRQPDMSYLTKVLTRQ